nr:MAG TPA: hypothetical protein [Caudoviricetes sp.]
MVSRQEHRVDFYALYKHCEPYYSRVFYRY